MLAFGTAGLKPEELAKLAEWPADLELDPLKMGLDDFLVDKKQRRVVAVLPDFDDFEWHDWHKNRGGLFVAWTPDGRRGLANCVGRWEDDAIVWMDAAAGKFPSVKDPLEKAYAVWLRTHEKKVEIGSMLFSNPAALGPDVVVLDAVSEIPKSESTERSYRLQVRLTPGKDGAVRCEILAGHKLKDAIEPVRLDDVDVNTAETQRRGGV